MSVPSLPQPGPDADLAAALDGSACLGAWTHDVPADRFRVAASFGHLLDLAPDEAAGVPLARVLGGVHAEDRARVEGLLGAAREVGGPFEAEFRTWEGRRGSRWIRLMGRTEIDGALRPVRACGLAFDLTEGRRARGGGARQAQWRANQIADHAIALKGLVSPREHPSLTRLVDQLAMEVGFELARCLRRAATEDRH